MWHISKTRGLYSILGEKDSEYGLIKHDALSTTRQSDMATFVRNSLIILLTTIVSFSTVVFWLTLFGVVPYPATYMKTSQTIQVEVFLHDHECKAPTVRQEWRTLSEEQQLDYVAAVQCLATRPSILHPNASMYDDFPWIHKELSEQTHRAANFLPWHREFIHLYEKALKEECGLQGNIPYWDWSLDWTDPAASPIWDGTTGFGGNGNVNGTEVVGNGRCVSDGPFANLEPKYFDGHYQPHCLSRGFAPQSELKTLGELIQPSAIEAMMQEPRYYVFEESLERRAHRFLSHSVRGDLSRFTGPNDPIFFLHHANIDRLWWRWQQAGPKSRLYEYNSQVGYTFDSGVSLADVMSMYGLGSDLPVAHVMETTNGRLCYTY